MEERLRFIAHRLDGEAMTDVCRQFGVSRKTGYRISSTSPRERNRLSVRA
jgi:transposase-like protein